MLPPFVPHPKIQKAPDGCAHQIDQGECDAILLVLREDVEPLRQNTVRKRQRRVVDELPADQCVDVTLDMDQPATAGAQQAAHMFKLQGRLAHAGVGTFKQNGLSAKFSAQRVKPLLQRPQVALRGEAEQLKHPRAQARGKLEHQPFPSVDATSTSGSPASASRSNSGCASAPGCGWRTRAVDAGISGATSFRNRYAFTPFGSTTTSR